MKAFERARLNMPKVKDFIKFNMELGATRAQAKAAYDRMRKQDIWLNDQYQVNIDRNPEHNFGKKVPVVHLSIKRIDKEPIHDWRDLQAIKNMLLGPEIEAVELFPAESRLVDTANQYHLWAIVKEDYRFPFGWRTRMVDKVARHPQVKQREIKEVIANG